MKQALVVLVAVVLMGLSLLGVMALAEQKPEATMMVIPVWAAIIASAALFNGARK